MALSSVSMGATLADINTKDTNLKAYWNFDSSGSPTVNSTSITWNELPARNSAGYGVCTDAAKHPYTNNAGLKAKDGFTVSFDINNAQDGTLLSMTASNNMGTPWRNLSITLNEGVVSAQFHGAMGTAVSTTLTNSQLTTEWTTLTLVGSQSSTDTDTFIIDFYVNGTHLGTSSTDSANLITGDSTINRMQFGYYGNSPNSAPTNIDNILIYSKALSAKEVKALTIPEPATATLSLLALAGLAMRRRRH